MAGRALLPAEDPASRAERARHFQSLIKTGWIISPDVDFEQLASMTRSHTLEEIEQVVQNALTNAFVRAAAPDGSPPVVNMDDFTNGIGQVDPELARHRPHGILSCGDAHKLIYEQAMLLVRTAKATEGTWRGTCLLHGPHGSGKTALAFTVGIDCNFPHVEIVSPYAMDATITEAAVCAEIEKAFDGAYESPLSIIILDDVERLLRHFRIGPQFSRSISQTLVRLLARPPPEGKKLLVIGTTSELDFLDSVGVRQEFSVTYHVPLLKAEDAKQLLEQLNVFSEDDVDAAAKALNDLPIKKICQVIDRAADGESGRAAEAVYAGREKIEIGYFHDCLKEVVRR